MTKTEKNIIEKVKSRGFFVGVGKRIFDAAQKLKASGEMPDACFEFEVYNANGPEFRSQWDSPKQRTAYEVAIRAR